MSKTIHIEGMMCGHCEATVKKALEALDGVTGAAVSHEAGTAVVTLSRDVADADLKAAVEAKDYTVTGIDALASSAAAVALPARCRGLASAITPAPPPSIWA